MTELTHTRHADQRLRQRGRSQQDVETVFRYGTPIDRDCVILLDKDVDREIAFRKREIAILERLRGWQIAVDDNIVITIYKPERIRAKPSRRNKSN